MRLSSRDCFASSSSARREVFVVVVRVEREALKEARAWARWSSRFCRSWERARRSVGVVVLGGSVRKRELVVLARRGEMPVSGIVEDVDGEERTEAIDGMGVAASSGMDGTRAFLDELETLET